jgi:m7GpppX diphosphatase
LNDGAESAQLSLLGHFGSVPGIVKLARLPLPSSEGDLAPFLSAMQLAERAPYSGAEFAYYVDVQRGLSVDVLAPHATATAEEAGPLLARHVLRCTAQQPFLFRETAEAYRKAHAPLIAASPPAALAWVWKILALEKEAERLVLSVPGDDGFLVNTDPKWSSHPSPTDLYCLALVHRRGLASIRDLRAEHLPLLLALRDVAVPAVAAKYGTRPDQLRAFFHFPPQFHHIHLHITAVNVVVGHGCYVERAHLLEDVIDNIQRDGEHYAKCAITVRCGERDPLLAAYRALGE